MSNELTVTALPGETPRLHMARLGKLSKQIMTGRYKAMTDGLDAIHKALCSASKAVEAEQDRLLAEHPELVMMAFEV